jgi:hypothetical protein
MMLALLAGNGAGAEPPVHYRLLATSRTSTMEKELNATAREGCRFEAFMGGGTLVPGSELVAIVRRLPADDEVRYEYRLLATNRTSTMEREMAQAGADGFLYRGQTVYDSTFGGREVVVVLERRRGEPPVRYQYRLLATKKTATMEKELQAAARDGFIFLGETVAETAFGGDEVVVILGRPGE